MGTERIQNGMRMHSRNGLLRHLLKKAKSLGRRENLRASKTTYPLTPSLNIDLCKMKCKDYYWLYINGTTCIATGPKKWEKELKSGNTDWKAKFNNIGKICHGNRLREFNFKLLNRLTVTKKELCIYGMMKIIVHTVKSQTLFSILSLNATTVKLFVLKLLHESFLV